MTPERTSAGKLSHWFIGLFLLIVALAGTMVASHAASETTYTLGLAVTGAGILGIFLLIKRHFDTN